MSKSLSTTIARALAANANKIKPRAINPAPISTRVPNQLELDREAKATGEAEKRKADEEAVKQFDAAQKKRIEETRKIDPEFALGLELLRDAQESLRKRQEAKQANENTPAALLTNPSYQSLVASNQLDKTNNR